MTYNTNALGFFRDSTKYKNNRKVFHQWVLDKDYDVYCFQEMVEVNKQPLDIEGYTRLSSLKTTKDDHHLGLFIYTKLPIVRHDKIEWAFNSYNRLMWADLVAGNDTIRVINVHMVSYDFAYHSVRQNILKVKNALKARSWHSKLIERFISESPYPVILCGDFNELPQSYPCIKMRRILNDAFATSGAGYAHTYNFKGIPIRIDQVFTSDELKSGNYEVIDEPLWSDHRPISIEIGRRDPGE
ncbi:MAG: endonuclease/exonuclease/phosphatase family protein [Bacteroidota bacterium]